MDSNIKEIVDLLLYHGPEIKELINQAVNEKKGYETEFIDNFTILKIYSTLPYGLEVIDVYVYSNENKLIKQTLIIGEKEKVIFDKFEEAETLLNGLEVICKAS